MHELKKNFNLDLLLFKSENKLSLKEFSRLAKFFHQSKIWPIVGSQINLPSSISSISGIGPLYKNITNRVNSSIKTRKFQSVEHILPTALLWNP